MELVLHTDIPKIDPQMNDIHEKSSGLFGIIGVLQHSY